MTTPMSPERLAEIHAFAGIDFDSDSYEQAVTLALRDALTEIDRLGELAAMNCRAATYAFNRANDNGVLAISLRRRVEQLLGTEATR